MVLFGGVDNYANTWIWNGSRWTLAEPATSPAGRIDAAAAYDPQTKQVLLFGGRHAPYTSGPSLNDTWAWDGVTWRELDRGVGRALRRARDRRWRGMTRSTRWCWSPLPAAVPGGDETWVWSGLRWVLKIHGAVAPSAFDLPMAFDPITRSLIAEGCCYAPRSQLGALDTTWRWNGDRWLQLAGTAAPLPGSSLALDPSSGRLALCNCGPMLALPALASWTGQTWELLRCRSPAVRTGGGDHRQRPRSAPDLRVGNPEQSLRGAAGACLVAAWVDMAAARRRRRCMTRVTS